MRVWGGNAKGADSGLNQKGEWCGLVAHRMKTQPAAVEHNAQTTTRQWRAGKLLLRLTEAAKW